MLAGGALPEGAALVYYPIVSSTNDLAARLAEQGCPDSTIVVADEQIAGRGRGGHTWYSPPGAGLYTSVVVDARLGDAPADWTRWLTLAAGVAISEGLHAASGLPVAIKWPNDLVIAPSGTVRGARKLGGILAEARSDGGLLTHVIVGFGVNVQRSAFPPEISARATSLEDELGREVDRGRVLAASLRRLLTWLRRLRAGQTAAVVERWRELAVGRIGRRRRMDARRQPAARRHSRHRCARARCSFAPAGRPNGSSAARSCGCERGRVLPRHRKLSDPQERRTPRSHRRPVVRAGARLGRDIGIPLKVVFAGIDRYFERYYAKGPRRRPVRIDFCEADVLDVFDEWRRAVGLAAGRTEIVDGEAPARRRESLATHLERSLARLVAMRSGSMRGTIPDAVLAEVVSELDRLMGAARGARGDARQSILDRLEELDARLLAAARAATPDDAMAPRQDGSRRRPEAVRGADVARGVDEDAGLGHRPCHPRARPATHAGG